MTKRVLVVAVTVCVCVHAHLSAPCLSGSGYACALVFCVLGACDDLCLWSHVCQPGLLACLSVMGTDRRGRPMVAP